MHASISQYTSAVNKYYNLIAYIRKVVDNGKIKVLTKSQRAAILNRYRRLKRILNKTLTASLLSASLFITESSMLGQCTDNTLKAPIFNPAATGLNLPGIRASIALGDVDQDGIEDIIGKGSEWIQFYKGRGNDRYEHQLLEENNPFRNIRLEDLDDIFLTNILTANSHPELIIGRTDGTIDLYSCWTGTCQIVNPSDNPFNGIDVGTFASPWVGDWDGDFNKDAFIGSGDGHILYYELESGSFVERTGSDNPFDGIDVGSMARPFILDDMLDDPLELAVGNEDGQLFYYKFNSLSSNYELQNTIFTNPFYGIDVGHLADPCVTRFGSTDNLFDLLVGNNDGRVTTYNNPGGGLIITSDTTDLLYGVHAATFAGADPAFIDWDDDGDEDIFIGTAQGNIQFWENQNNLFLQQTGTFNPFNSINLDYPISPEFGNVYGDMELELVDGSSFNPAGALFGRLGFYHFGYQQNGKKIIDFINTISASNPTHLSPALVDQNTDGLMDIFVGDAAGKVSYFENIGGGNFELREGTQNPFDGIDVGSYASPLFLDIDDDGSQDALIGYDSGIKYFEYDFGSNKYVERSTKNPLSGLKMTRAKLTKANLLKNGKYEIIIGSNGGYLSYFFQADASNCYRLPADYQNSYVGPGGEWNTSSSNWTSFILPWLSSHANIPAGRHCIVDDSDFDQLSTATIKVQVGATFEVFGQMIIEP